MDIDEIIKIAKKIKKESEYQEYGWYNLEEDIGELLNELKLFKKLNNPKK